MRMRMHTYMRMYMCMYMHLCVYMEVLVDHTCVHRADQYPCG